MHYFDNAATTPVRPEAAQAALEALSAQRGWGRVWLTRTLPRGEKSVAIT